MTGTFVFSKYAMGHSASASFAEASSCAKTTRGNFIALILDAITMASIIIALITLSLVLGLRVAVLVLVSLLLVAVLITDEQNKRKRRQAP